MEILLILAIVIVAIAITRSQSTSLWVDSKKRFNVKYSNQGRRIACVGDSNTLGGFKHSYKKTSYPSHLQRILGEGYIVENFGINGATAIIENGQPFSKTKAYGYSLDFKPEMVILNFGTNDSKTDVWNRDNFTADYSAIIETYLGMKSVKETFICIPIPSYNNSCEIQENIINSEIRNSVIELANKYEIKYIDLHSALSNKQEYYKKDLVHLKLVGYKIVAEEIHNAIKTE